MFGWWDDFVLFVTDLWNEFMQMVNEYAVLTVDGALQALASIIGAIPVPTFLANGLAAITGALPSDILYFLGQSGLDTGMGLVAAGVAFRLARKVATLGIW